MDEQFSARSREHIDGAFAPEEVALAARNPGMPLEALAYDVTPLGMHYQLHHFDIPAIDARNWRLRVAGRVARPLDLSLEAVQALPAITQRVTLECAGNGRALMRPRYPSRPWFIEAVSTADWTGARLADVLEQAHVDTAAVEVSFQGADRGFDMGNEHHFGRSLPLARALAADVLLAYAMNGQPLAPQHGAPLRLVVPGWYGMASVKWLTRIEALDQPFTGYQQAVGYHYRKTREDPGVPVTTMRVRALMIPPGIPDWYSRARLVDRGPVLLRGRAWSGGGVPVDRVEVGVNGVWHRAELDPPAGPYAWCGWHFSWRAEPGAYQLACRARDANGDMQPDVPDWNTSGMGNNVWQTERVFVR